MGYWGGLSAAGEGGEEGVVICGFEIVCASRVKVCVVIYEVVAEGECSWYVLKTFCAADEGCYQSKASLEKENHHCGY